MDISFTDEVALITGGTSGIGLAIARKLGKSGCRIAICARRKGLLAQALEELGNEGIDAWGDSVDISKPRAYYNFAEECTRRFGSIDILVNNASVYPQKMLMDMDHEEFDALLQTNLGSVFSSIRIARDFMAPSRSGVIINASSFASVMGSVGSGAYAASKSAISMLTRCMAAEFAPHGIRVVAYVPGLIETDMTRPVIQKNPKRIVENIALKRLGNADEVADAVVFLASDKASYITGTSLEISGGKYCTQNPQAAWS